MPSFLAFTLWENIYLLHNLHHWLVTGPSVKQVSNPLTRWCASSSWSPIRMWDVHLSPRNLVQNLAFALAALGGKTALWPEYLYLICSDALWGRQDRKLLTVGIIKNIAARKPTHCAFAGLLICIHILKIARVHPCFQGLCKYNSESRDFFFSLHTKIPFLYLFFFMPVVTLSLYRSTLLLLLRARAVSAVKLYSIKKKKRLEKNKWESEWPLWSLSVWL